MKPENNATHVIDPDGNVTIILQNANKRFVRFIEESSLKRKRKTPFVTQEFRILVSASHLTSVSPVFKSALEGTWKEGLTLRSAGSVNITVDGWDLEALLILLRICHCKHHQVPRTLGLELLAKITLLVDYYQCFDVLRFFADTWISCLAQSFPTQYSRDVLLWVWISWAWKMPALFKKATGLIISQATGSITSLGLPIPQRIIDDINVKRLEAIRHTFSSLDSLQTSLIEGKRGCSLGCRSIMLGTLILQRHSKGLLTPIGTAPRLVGLKAGDLVTKVCNFSLPEWHSGGDRNGRAFNCHRGIMSCLNSELELSLRGLDLQRQTA
ncbi:hypothetical protein AFLA70_304g001121 [Aspergillus flavus AF70]|nr:hypothetical protein AFLA70_304g001121 [Aspergillus flavus AF70]